MKPNKISLTITLLLIGLFQFTNLTAQSQEGIMFYKVGYLEQAKMMLESELASSVSNKAQLYYYLGNIYFKQMQPEKALEAYQQGLSSDPKNLYNAIGLTKLVIKSNPNKAESKFKEIQKKSKKDLNIVVEIGRAYLDNEEPQIALNYLTIAHDKDFQFAPAHILWGDIFEFRSEPGEAASKYQNAIFMDPLSYEAYIKYARIMSHVNREAAIGKLQELKRVEPTLSLVDKELSELYYKKNDFSNAASAYGNYIKAGTFTNDDLKQYALTLLFAGEYNQSLEIAQKGLQADPTDPAFSRMVMYNLIDLEQYEEATAAADHFFNRSKNPEFSYFDYMYQGRLYNGLRQHAKAGEAYLKAIEKDPGNKQLYQMASQSYEKAANATKSAEILEKFIRETKEEKNPEDLYELGRKYYKLAGDSTSVLSKEESLDKAIQFFSEVHSLEPDNYRSFFWKGMALELKDPEATTADAKESYEKTLDIIYKNGDIERYNDPIRIASYYLCVYYYIKYEQTNDEVSKSNTIKYAKEVLRVDPENAVAKQLVDYFESNR